MSGTGAILIGRTDGYGGAAVVNQRPGSDDFSWGLGTMLREITDGVSAWPSYDHF